jgi:isocitrate dehydrogenase
VKKPNAENLMSGRLPLMIKYAGADFAIGRKNHAALTNKKQENLTKSMPITYASGVGFAMTARNIKQFFYI